MRGGEIKYAAVPSYFLNTVLICLLAWFFINGILNYNRVKTTTSLIKELQHMDDKIKRMEMEINDLNAYNQSTREHLVKHGIID